MQPSLPIEVPRSRASGAAITDVVYVPSQFCLPCSSSSEYVLDDDHFCSLLCDAGFTVHIISTSATATTIDSSDNVNTATWRHPDDGMVAEGVRWASETTIGERIERDNHAKRLCVVVASELAVPLLLGYLADISALRQLGDRNDPSVDYINSVLLVDPPPVNAMSSINGRQRIIDRYRAPLYRELDECMQDSAIVPQKTPLRSSAEFVRSMLRDRNLVEKLLYDYYVYSNKATVTAAATSAEIVRGSGAEPDSTLSAAATVIWQEELAMFEALDKQQEHDTRTKYSLGASKASSSNVPWQSSHAVFSTSSSVGGAVSAPPTTRKSGGRKKKRSKGKKAKSWFERLRTNLMARFDIELELRDFTAEDSLRVDDETLVLEDMLLGKRPSNAYRVATEFEGRMIVASSLFSPPVSQNLDVEKEIRSQLLQQPSSTAESTVTRWPTSSPTTTITDNSSTTTKNSAVVTTTVTTTAVGEAATNTHQEAHDARTANHKNEENFSMDDLFADMEAEFNEAILNESEERSKHVVVKEDADDADQWGSAAVEEVAALYCAGDVRYLSSSINCRSINDDTESRCEEDGVWQDKEVERHKRIADLVAQLINAEN